MIYLIDDKKNRQSIDYNWTDERLKQYREYIRPIYTLEELIERNKEIFSEDNIILYHESFIDQTTLNKEAVEKRNKLQEFSQRKENLLAYFSGSKSERIITENIAHLPVSILYQNLEAFVKKYDDGDIDFKYLLYGENPEIEEQILKKLEEARDYIDDNEKEPASITGKTLFLDFAEVEIASPINETDIYNLGRNNFNYFPDDFSDSIQSAFKNNTYKHIYIPLCFGSSLSDYNGLRLATHIRCTEGLNQTSNIYIYGVVELIQLISNSFFDILKTKNVFYINMSKKEFKKIAHTKKPKLAKEDIAFELKKINLSIPKNYYDNHSIANVWGVYQIARNAGINLEEVEGFEKEKFNDIYFKWLIAKNNLNKSLPKEQLDEQKRYAECLPGITLVGKIDLSKINSR